MDILSWSQGNASYQDGTTESLVRQGDALAEDLRSHLQYSMSLLRSVFRLFPLDQISLTFNGGKDACVVFHLARAAIADYIATEKGVCSDEDLARALSRIKVMYVYKHIMHP